MVVLDCYTFPPINLNCWKHHAGFIKDQINSITNTDELEDLKSVLLKIGSSQMDLYLGHHPPEEISTQILDILRRNGINSIDLYKKWISEENKDYKLVELKDKSVWTLRLGENAQKYVHIHPGRYSPHTVRVKATTLKTAIFILCFLQLDETETLETGMINNIRTGYLNEPPLKSFSTALGLKKLVNLLMKT